MSHGIGKLYEASVNSELVSEFVEKHRDDAVELAKLILSLLEKNEQSAKPAKQKERIAVKMELSGESMEKMPTSSATVRAEKKCTLTLRGSRNYLA